MAVSREQHDMLRDLMSREDNLRARIWVAMEYRFMPAVAKLLQLLPKIGDIKMVSSCSFRENYTKKGRVSTIYLHSTNH